MAVELLAFEFLFLPKAEDEASNKLVLDLGPPYKYYALHDIESAWWIGAWMLFFNHPKGYIESESEDQRFKRQASTEKVFPGALVHEGRRDFLSDARTFQRRIEWMSALLRTAAGMLLTFGLKLKRLYETIEQSFPGIVDHLSTEPVPAQTSPRPAFPGSPFDSAIYDQFGRIWETACEESRSIELIPFRGTGFPVDVGKPNATPDNLAPTAEDVALQCQATARAEMATNDMAVQTIIAEASLKGMETNRARKHGMLTRSSVKRKIEEQSVGRGGKKKRRTDKQ